MSHDIKPNDLKRFAARYHRNGVCGAGFHACAFEWDGRNMTAAVFEGGPYAVMSEYIGDAWRGDHFIDALRVKIAESDASGASFRGT